jgi:tetratricopeptide (TPR) repeat protein
MKLKWIILILLVVAASWVYLSDKTSQDPEFVGSTLSNTSTAAAGALISVGQYDAAVVFADLALPVVTADQDLLMAKGKALSALGRDAEASACYDQILSEDPDTAGALAGKATALFRMGDMESSYAYAMDALAIDETDLAALERAGAASLNLGRYAEAADYYDQIVTLKPDEAAAWIRRGDALLSISILMEEEMKTQFSNLGKPGATMNALNIDPYMEAMECYNRAISLDPMVAPMLATRMIARSQMTINTCQDILENL